MSIVMFCKYYSKLAFQLSVILLYLIKYLEHKLFSAHHWADR